MALWGKSGVEADDKGVRRYRRGRLIEEVSWDQLAGVSIRTTSGGPVEDDVFWLLESNAGGGVVVPSESPAARIVLQTVQRLPDFDNEAVIKAMGCATDDLFVCWRRPVS